MAASISSSSATIAALKQSRTLNNNLRAGQGLRVCRSDTRRLLTSQLTSRRLIARAVEQKRISSSVLGWLLT
jgi:hypothetical protein